MTQSDCFPTIPAFSGMPPWRKTLFGVEYFYADNGMVTGRKINGDMQHYRYDKRGQLLSVTDAKGQILERYSYDPAGNILAKTIYGQTTTYTYDAANQLVSSTVDGRTTRYEYDAAGRLVKEGSKEYKYGYLDKILAVQENGRTTAAFDYHMDGQIATAMTDKGDESFLWDGLALIRRNDTNLVNEPYATGGNPIVSGNDVLFNDMLGSTLGVKGQQNARISMTAFGSVRRTAESAAQAPADAYGAEADVYFTGKPQVGELGYAFLLRNYRSEQGKWQTQDPLDYPDSWNNFAYGNNCILSGVDALGTEWVRISGSVPRSEAEVVKNVGHGSFNVSFSLPNFVLDLKSGDGGTFSHDEHSQIVKTVTNTENSYSNPNGTEKGDTWTQNFTYSQGTYKWDTLTLSFDIGSPSGAGIRTYTSSSTLDGNLSTGLIATVVYVWG